MAPSLREMFGKLTLHKKKSGQEDTNSSTPLLQRSDDDLKTRAQHQQQQQQQQQHQEREEEYQRLFPKRNDIQHHDDDEDKINQPDPTPHPVLRPKSSFPASGKRFLPRKKFLIPTSKFAVSQPPLPEPSSIPERDEQLSTVANPSVTYPDCRPPVKRVQARGCLFDIAPMPLSSHPPIDEKDDSSQPEGLQQSSSSSSPSSSTTTTLHRQERADSHQEDVTTPITTATATATTNPEVTSRDFASPPRDVLTVPALSIRKNLQPPTTSTTSTSTSTTGTRIPSSSPRSSPHSPSEKMSVPPQTAENERKRDSEAAYTTAKMASPTTSSTFREKLWGAGPSSSASAASNNNNKDSAGGKTFGLRDQTRLIPAGGAGPTGGGGKARQATLPSSSALNPASNSGGGGGIPVRPPLYDFHKPAGLQWASPGITNSRPAAPWVSYKKKSPSHKS